LLSVTQFESFKTYNVIPYTDNLSKTWSCHAHTPYFILAWERI